MRPERPALPEVRTAFLSDLHLGSPHCQADELLACLQQLRCERLYLVGDILDLWWIRRRRLCWSATETAIFERLRRLPGSGTELIYLPGNHDEPLRGLVGQTIGAATVRRRAIHATADGRRLLVTHGDEFDAQTHRGDLRERFGEWCYDSLCGIDAALKTLRIALGLRRWSLARYVKTHTPAAQAYVARYRAAVLADARRRGLDGAICGHIHQPELLETADGLYANDGDFVEHCSALVETRSGALKLVEWHGGEALLQPALHTDLAGLDVDAALQRQRP